MTLNTKLLIWFFTKHCDHSKKINFSESYMTAESFGTKPLNFLGKLYHQMINHLSSRHEYFPIKKYLRCVYEAICKFNENNNMEKNL